MQHSFSPVQMQQRGNQQLQELVEVVWHMHQLEGYLCCRCFHAQETLESQTTENCRQLRVVRVSAGDMWDNLYFPSKAVTHCCCRELIRQSSFQLVCNYTEAEQVFLSLTPYMQSVQSKSTLGRHRMLEVVCILGCNLLCAWVQCNANRTQLNNW